MADRPIGGRASDPTPELSLTRTGGGRTKWLVALLALVVLGGVIYIGVTGPNRAVVAPPTSPQPVQALASPSLKPAATPYPDNEVVALRADPDAPVLYQFLGTALTLNGHGTLATLDPVGPNAYRGIYRIPYSQAGPIARIELNAVTASVSHDDLDRLGDWAFPLSIARADSAPMTVFSTGGPPTTQTLTSPDFQRLATDGFQLTVTVSAQSDAALMTIDVVVQPHLFVKDEVYSVLAGRPDSQFVVPLEQYGIGGYDGEAVIPRNLYGTTITVSMAVVSPSDPSRSASSVGTWTIDVPARPRNNNLNQITAGYPGTGDRDDPAILANGYMLGIGEKIMGDDLELLVGLNVTAVATTGPVPTR